MELEMDSNTGLGAGRSILLYWLQRFLVGRHPRRTLVRIAVLLGCSIPVFVLFGLVLLPVRVRGPSMLPTFREGGINFVNRLAYWGSSPRRGEVVAIRPSNPSFLPPSVMYMKRVVGLPGEKIAFHEGHLYVNGKRLEEPYVKKKCDWESMPVTLAPDQYYVVGDNRSMPEVYHEEGRVRRDHIVGKVLLCKSLFDSSPRW